MAVTFSEFEFPSASGCNTIKGGVWSDDAVRPRAVIQLVHGMCEYVGRYDAMARHFAAGGIAVIGADHLGHGKSARDAGELGYFAKKDGYLLVVEDAHTVTNKAKELFPDIPVFLYGHSMGSFITEAYLGKYGADVKGAIVSGTGGPNPILGVAITIAGVIGLFKGEKHRSTFIDNLAFGKYCARIPDKKTEKDWITRDDAIVAKYVKDPFCMYVFTVSAFKDLFRMIGAATDKELPGRIPKTVSLFYIAGSEDPVGDYGKGPQTVYERMSAAGISDCAFKLYKDMRHEPHNEFGKEDVYADVMRWVNERA